MILSHAAPGFDTDGRVKIAIGLFDHGVRRIDICHGLKHLGVFLTRLRDGIIEGAVRIGLLLSLCAYVWRRL